MASVPHAVELTVLQPNLAPAKHLVATPVVSFGRSAECTIPIRDRFLSRRHAEMIWTGERWLLRDLGSVNGTFVNGKRVNAQQLLGPGDRIAFGDSEIVFQPAPEAHEPGLSVIDSDHTSAISVPFNDLVSDKTASRRAGSDDLQIVNQLALELIEDRPLSELFDFIIDKVISVFRPSRALLGIFGDDSSSFSSVNVRTSSGEPPKEVVISRTLLKEVVDGRKVISFFDSAENEKFAQAKSIIGQSIRSAVCAPLVVGDSVKGILYLDYVINEKHVSEEDVRLLGKVARFAAVKLETTRLREESLLKQRLDEELRTAYIIQSRLLPAAPPVVNGFDFAGTNHPCRTVSGDYFDFVTRDDGKIYFVIADVSGKGVTAALVMASFATALNIFARQNPTPAELLREVNLTLTPKLSPTRFVTTFVGLLDPATGHVDFANAGHVPPLLVARDGVTELRTTDLVVGLFTTVKYRDQSTELAPGDSLVLFTDGIVEAENEEGNELGAQPVIDLVTPMHACAPSDLISRIEQRVRQHVGTTPQGDDVTILVLSRSA